MQFLFALLCEMLSRTPAAIEGFLNLQQVLCDFKFLSPSAELCTTSSVGVDSRMLDSENLLGVATILGEKGLSGRHEAKP